MTKIASLTPLDGRYANLVTELADIFSEQGLIRHRIQVEVEWLKFIINDLHLDNGKGRDFSALDRMIETFGETEALRVKEIESRTNHDVKAVEYFIKEAMDREGMDDIREWVHFACTSDDINNTAYALMLDRGKTVCTELLSRFLGAVEEKAQAYKGVPMMSRTHGQPATPTTVGKEFVNFAWRMKQEFEFLSSRTVQAKMNGATGNYNAHLFAYPDIDWVDASQRFISSHLKLDPILFTTQINPNNALAQVLHSLVRAAATMIDFDRDMWGYISLGYFKQRIKKGETGSSTMPHKVNPIDFENSEGNMGIAISLMEHLAVKLQKSRFQRDLSDSPVLRSLGSAFGYFAIGVQNALKGLSKVELNQEAIAGDLEANQELLAEPFQTVMRVYGEENPYERLKDLTRGQKITKADLESFVDGLENVPQPVKARMKELTPATYVGLAEKLVDIYFR